MIELEAALFELLDPGTPAVAVLGEPTLRALARTLAATAREAVEGVIRLSDCDVQMRRTLYHAGYPRELAAGAARRMAEHVA